MEKFRENIAFIEMGLILISLVIGMLLIVPSYGNAPIKDNINILVLGASSMTLVALNVVGVLPVSLYLSRREVKAAK